MQRREFLTKFIPGAALTLAGCSTSENSTVTNSMDTASQIDTEPSQESPIKEYEPVKMETGFLMANDGAKIEFPVIEIDRQIIIDLLSSTNGELKISVYGSEENPPLNFSYDYENALTENIYTEDDFFQLVAQNEQVLGTQYFHVEAKLNGEQTTTKIEIVRVPIVYMPYDGKFDPEQVTQLFKEKNIFAVSVPEDPSKIKSMVVQIDISNLPNGRSYNWGTGLHNYSVHQ